MVSPLYTKNHGLYSIGGIFVHRYQVQFASLADVMRFVTLATKLGFPITVGTETYFVNGTSFMGMFTLNWSQPQSVTLECTDEQAERFRQEAARFLIDQP